MAQRTLSRRGRRHDDDDYDPTPDESKNVGRYDDDDDYDDRPARGRGRSRRDDEDEAPRSRRAAAYDDDEPPARGRSRRDDEPPARGRSRRDDEPPARARRRPDDDEPPARSRGRGGYDDDDQSSRRPRRSGRDDDDRRPPSRGRGRDEEHGPRRGATSTTVGRGWGGYDSVKDTGADYVKTWKLPTKPTLIKFLDDEPFSTYAEHWLDEQKGKKSFVCLGEDCPLCDDLGDRPSAYALFNILDLTDPDNPKVEVWKTGKRVAGILRNYSEDRKTSPLSREDLYWSIFKSGEKGGNVQTNLNPVKARDLVEDWDCDPFTDEELDEFDAKLHTEEEIITVSPRKELRAIAASYDD